MVSQRIKERAEMAGIGLLVGILVVAWASVMFGSWGLQAIQKEKERGDRWKAVAERHEKESLDRGE